MQTFTAVTDESLASTIKQARSRVVLVTPGVSEVVARAIDALTAAPHTPKAVLILDPDEDAYRVGYGDQKGIELLRTLVGRPNVTLRAQRGMRTGVLIADEEILLWAPTPKSVEGKRTANEPNGIRLDPSGDVSEQLNQAVGSDEPNTVLTKADIGHETLTPEQVTKTVEALMANPPAPVDLSNMARVFSTKIQFVECTLRGAQWTERETNVSNLLLNADVPDDLKELFDTKIRPYSKQVDVAIEVPAMIRGQLAYDKTGQPIFDTRTQAQIRQDWDDILKRYVHRMKGFGHLIRRTDKATFEGEVAAFQTVLKAWVEGFKTKVDEDGEALVAEITRLVLARMTTRPTTGQPAMTRDQVEKVIRGGIQRMRVIEPSVKLVFKDVSWESTGDPEFRKALADVLPRRTCKDGSRSTQPPHSGKPPTCSRGTGRRLRRLDPASFLMFTDRTRNSADTALTDLTNSNLNEMFDMADENLSLRHFSSPIDEITEILDALEQYWKELGRKGSFYDFVSSTDRRSLPAADESQSAFRLRAAFMANIVAQAAMYSLRQGSVQDAWEHTADAKYHLGLVHGPGDGQPKDAARFMAKLRHRESDDCKRMVVTHYLEHRSTYRSKDAAAEEMANSLVPYPFRTVRDWLKGI